RRPAGGGAGCDRYRAHSRLGARHPRAAQPDRLQRGFGGDGVVVGGGAPREDGAAGARRREPAVHVVDRLGRGQPRRSRRHLGGRRGRVVRLAGERPHRGAENPVGARDGPGQAEAAGRGDPEDRLRRGDVRAVRPVGAADGVPQVGERRAAVPGAAVLERVDRLTVVPEIVRRLVATIPVVGVVAIAVLAVPLGVLAAWKKGSLIARAVMGFAVSGFSMPTFWLGFVLVYVFAVSLHWLPVQGFPPIERGLWPFLRHLIRPAVTLSLVFMAL